MDDPAKSRIAKDLITAEKTDEYWMYAASDPVLCYTYFIKFLLNKDTGINMLPILAPENNKDLQGRLVEYSKLFKLKV